MRMHFVQTYDLSTQLGKMGIVGIHTPTAQAVHRLYPGFFENFKRWRPVSCDITMACASMLPADPLQIGVEAGSIAPQDMFNPILYRAVTNDSMDAILSRVYNRITGNFLPTAQAAGSTVVDLENPFTGFDDTNYENMYYMLLSSDGWRKSMPQAGLSMTGLRPLVYNVVSNFGNNASGAPTNASVGTITNQNTIVTGSSGNGATLGRASTGEAFFRGETFPMPSLPTYAITNGLLTSAMPNGNETSGVVPRVECPISYIALLAMPPAKLNRLFYRLRVDWLIEWYDPCTVQDNSMPLAISSGGSQLYYNTYDTASKDMSTKTEVVDANDISQLNMVMESSR